MSCYLYMYAIKHGEDISKDETLTMVLTYIPTSRARELDDDMGANFVYDKYTKIDAPYIQGLIDIFTKEIANNENEKKDCLAKIAEKKAMLPKCISKEVYKQISDEISSSGFEGAVDYFDETIGVWTSYRNSFKEILSIMQDNDDKFDYYYYFG